MIFPSWRSAIENPSTFPLRSSNFPVESFASSRGIAVLDLLPEFAGFEGPELWVHPTNQHPNERAHAIAGHALFRFLQREKKLAPAPSQDLSR